MLDEGKKAPDFTLLRDGGEEVSLSDFRGQKVVLYFYPKDNTSGCTTQACEFRDQHPDFQKVDTVILGVSPDSVRSHQGFRDKHELPFPLLADTEHKVAEAYGVWKEKSMYGRKYWGIERSTFLIDEEGGLQKVWRKVKARGHAQEVLAAL